MAGKTYESLFKQQTEVYLKWVATTYAVEHIVVGIVSAVVLLGIAFTPMGAIFDLFGILNPAVRYAAPVLLGIGISALSALIDPGKKPLVLYLWGAISYFFKPKVFIGGHKKMKRWKGSSSRVKQQTVFTASEGGIPSPAVMIRKSGQLTLNAAMEAETVGNGILIRRVEKKRRRAVRLPYGRVTVTHEGRGRVGYHR
jgi:hypothetical protein